MTRGHRWIAIGAFFAGILAFVLGVWGFNRLREHSGDDGLDMHRAPAGEEVNQSLRLFTGNADYRDKKGSLGVELYAATILAYASVLSAGGLVVYLLIRQEWRELRLENAPPFRIRPAAVVFNLPESLRGLVTEFQTYHKRGVLGNSCEPVVVVLPDRSNPLAKVCERAGLWVIEANPLDEDVLDRCGALRAKDIFIFGDDSAGNLDLAISIQSKIGKTQDLSPPQPVIHAQVEDPDVRYAVANRHVGAMPETVELASCGCGCGGCQKATFYYPAILPFSFPAIAARDELGRGILATAPDAMASSGSRRHADATYVLFGRGPYVRSFVAEIIKNSVIDLETKPTLHLFCPEAESLEARVNAEIPGWKLLHATIHFHNVEDNTPEGYVTAARETIHKASAPCSPWNFFCLLTDDGDNLSLTARLTAELASSHVPEGLKEWSRILYLARHTTRLAESFQTFTAPSRKAILLLGDTATLRSIRQDSLLAMAYRIHEGYLTVTRMSDELEARARVVANFQGLLIVQREQNFSQAAHLDVKLAALGHTRKDPPKDILATINALLPENWKTGLSDLSGPPGTTAKRDGTAVGDILSEGTAEAERVPVTLDKNFDISRFAPEIQRLAELEHLRWLQTHYLAGYRHMLDRNDDLRHQDCLLPFSDSRFPKRTIPYDIEAIRLLPELVQLHQETST